MIRHYTDEPISPDAIERILASALRAPSAGFSQGWAFLVLTEAEDRSRFWPYVPTRVEQTPSMQLAPLVIVPLAHKAAYLERYAEPDKGWAVARAVLVHRHGHGLTAHPPHGRR
jgi:nitroreductase